MEKECTKTIEKIIELLGGLLKGKPEKEDLIDEKIAYIRISETDKKRDDWPIRISILQGQKQGLPMGEFGRGCNLDCSLPGDTITIESAIELRDALDRIIKKHGY